MSFVEAKLRPRNARRPVRPHFFRSYAVRDHANLRGVETQRQEKRNLGLGYGHDPVDERGDPAEKSPLMSTQAQTRTGVLHGDVRNTESRRDELSDNMGAHRP